jgi:quinol monooxygenase YgiN
MKYIQARYTVRPEKVALVKKAISAFVSAIQLHEPRTLYVVFREGESPTFVHLMSFQSEAAERRHAKASYVDRFVKKLYPHCVGRPEFSDLGSFASSRADWMTAGRLKGSGRAKKG